MAKLDVLLERLSGLKSTGPDRWIARCPAHADRSPSMTVRAMSDGRILLHCFAGCDPQDVLSNVGLNFGDLFPEPLTRDSLPRIRAAFSAHEALLCLSTESGIVALAASDLAEGRESNPDRVSLAAGRIASALEAIHA